MKWLLLHILVLSVVACESGDVRSLPVDEASATRQNLALVTADYPVISAAPSLICAGKKFFNTEGVLLEGTRSCLPTPPSCSLDGETNCITSAAFKAADTSAFASGDLLIGKRAGGVIGSLDLSQLLPGNLVAGVTVAGVTGAAATETHAACSSDGAVGCVATSSHKALDATNVVAGNIRSGITMAGVAGTFVSGDPDCSADGEVGCVTVTSFKAVDMTNAVATNIKSGVTIAGVAGSLNAESHVTCGSDGETGCVVVAPLFKSADMSAAVAGNIRSGTTIAAVAGSFGPACGTDGEGACVVDGTTYKAALLANFTAADVRTGVTVAGVAGSAVIEAHTTCTSDGGLGCIADASYPAAAAAAAVAGNIKAGVTVAGTLGNYGPACGADGGASCLIDGVTYKAAKLANFTAADIKSGVTVAGIAGTATLEAHVDCGVDGATGCVATAAYPAAATAAAVAGNIKSGVTVAGILGNYGPGCSTDGEAACLVDGTTYKAAKLSNFVAGDVESGVTIAGVAGSATLETHVNCAADGAVGCVTTAAYPAADAAVAVALNIKSGIALAGVAGNHGPACLADGDGSCLVDGATFKAAKLSNFVAADLATGVTVAGVNGTATVESHLNCAADAATACVATAAYPAAAATAITAGNIKAGATIGGILGAYPSATYRLNGADATVDLPAFASTAGGGSYEWFQADGTRLTGTVAGNVVATPSASNQVFNAGLYRSVTVNGDADLVAGNIKNGANLFSVAGNYPSLASPLSGADGTADLDSATFDAKIKAATLFEWFDSQGGRYTSAGDADIAAGNIASGVVVFGTTGTLAGAPCTGDGQTGCMATATYKSGDTAAITSFDLRKGKTAAGIAGDIAFHKNMANNTLFNRTSGTGAAAGLDIYDTIDDYNNNSASFPNQTPGGWYQATGSEWIRDSLSDNGAGGGGSGNGVCDGSEHCVYLDRITGVYWAKADGTTRTWEETITHCSGLSYGGYSDWRMPTQKEQHQAEIDGVASKKSSSRLNLTLVPYHAATTVTGTPTYQYKNWLLNGYSFSSVKGLIAHSICVRP